MIGVSMQRAIDCTVTKFGYATTAKHCEMSPTFVKFTLVISWKNNFETVFLEQLLSTPEKKKKKEREKQNVKDFGAIVSIW